MIIRAPLIGLLVGLLVTTASWAEEASRTVNTPRPAPMDNANLIQWSGGLVLVLALIMGVAWLVRRYGHFNAAHAGQLKVLGGVSVGTREKVVLLKAGQHHLLLGVAPNQVSTLHVFERGEIDEIQTETRTDFSDSLRQALNRGQS